MDYWQQVREQDKRASLRIFCIVMGAVLMFAGFAVYGMWHAAHVLAEWLRSAMSGRGW